MNREASANFTMIFGWIFTSLNPSIIPQALSIICSILACVNYYYSIKEKRNKKDKE